MKVYIFTKWVDGFGADEDPAFEEGVYLNKDEAYIHLFNLNKKELKNWMKQDEKAKKLGINGLLNKYCINEAPPENMYSMYEIEVKE